MNLLAINTAEGACSVTLSQVHRDLSRSEPALHQQAEYLLPSIEDLLQEAELTLAELDAIAWSSGPASFTSLRLAFSAAQALALTHAIKLIPVGSLEAMAYAFYLQNVNHLQLPMRIQVCTNAHMGQVFFAVFEINTPGELVTEQAACLMKPEELLTLPLEGEGPYEAIGDGFKIYADALQVFINRYRLCPQVDFRSEAAKAVAQLARHKMNCVSEKGEPIYLRSAQAWKKAK